MLQVHFELNLNASLGWLEWNLRNMGMVLFPWTFKNKNYLYRYLMYTHMDKNHGRFFLVLVKNKFWLSDG